MNRNKILSVVLIFAMFAPFPISIAHAATGTGTSTLGTGTILSITFGTDPVTHITSVFVTLVDDTTAFYMVSQFYYPGAEMGIRWNDTSFKIKWPVEPLCITEKDSSWPDYLV